MAKYIQIYYAVRMQMVQAAQTNIRQASPRSGRILDLQPEGGAPAADPLQVQRAVLHRTTTSRRQQKDRTPRGISDVARNSAPSAMVSTVIGARGYALRNAPPPEREECIGWNSTNYMRA